MVWNTGFVGAGFLLGENWPLVERYGGFFQYAVLAAGTVAIGLFVIRRVKARKAV
ncbi:hypothetical protein AMES_3151 [Amycolatopsis mediterranei S699]|uniref:Uncharacterized protein n=2 Tax=Amycolatopsis mediterranei TaxID=33910 RepID=A0A0H3D424_AMYMU|nr:hypothetical protein [Amycolatopsis mediterranei]ADJ44976.1 conserved hypothetical protein [Amycolatopsis mediterranei U32]AEK41727.1 hypothetical protein RAM_16195 [Amycolatopsis mediterranei S699]AFO76687.1 hypothetical protein AMES_3151 [Amycolatopsis mediterranei S699]AGT83815.1 hypothetical protein B737_3151 [Amycolatopsis mediterranei RB]UZF70246.1 hypothetical protein ISP_003439 [Amycolatopsis mediterranei]